MASTSGGTVLSMELIWREPELFQPAPLEDHHQAAVGRGHRQHRHQHALERQEHRLDRDQQHDEGDQGDEDQHQRLGPGHLVVEVFDQRGRSTDVHLRRAGRRPRVGGPASSRWCWRAPRSSGSTDSTPDSRALLLLSANTGGATEIDVGGLAHLAVGSRRGSGCARARTRRRRGRSPSPAPGPARRGPAPRRPRTPRRGSHVTS